MKAEPVVQRRLLDLAGVDAELARLAHRRTSLPEHAELAAAEVAVRTAKDAVVEAETNAGDLDRDIRRIERDVDGVRARTERDHALLAGSGIGAKQAVEVQHELETLARRQGVLEDEQLEVMERREALQGHLDHARAQLDGAETAIGEITARRDTAIADLDAADAGRRRARDEVEATLPADLLTAYEHRRARQGTGAALLLQRRCQACRLELDRTAMSELRSAAPDAIVHCEECGVILVRTPESGL